MEKYLYCALGGVFLYSFAIYCWHKLRDEKINFKSINLYLALLFAILCGTIINFFVPQYLRIICFIFMLSLINYVFFCRALDKCLAAVIVFELLIMLCETLFVMNISLVVGSMETFMKSPSSVLIINAAVSVLSLLILQFPFPKLIYNYLLKMFNNMKNNTLIICLFGTVILATVFMIISYMKLPQLVLLLVNSTLVVIYIGIVIGLVSSQEKIRKINNKYETSLTSLREYEDIMDKYRVDNHENKNQLLTIRNMIKAKDKTTVKYIDKLVDNKIKDNENIFYTTSKIPEGGLRATIYSKLCKMKDANIDYTLDIANDVRTVDLIKLGDDTTLNICKIIGVFLDNAIEAVEQLDEKDIIVEIFVMDNDLYIEISNNYDGEIALEKISNKGYTTKGKGHGYGLSLVREIIKNDHNLENEKKIDREMFTQSLKIKM